MQIHRTGPSLLPEERFEIDPTKPPQSIHPSPVSVAANRTSMAFERSQIVIEASEI
ncbi:MAG: hypothetical protein H6696_12420 [Deferribacteres bacterium]|nr:hypothetical protein [candidate division KSB1 bacterium]MCB9502731.1 hypothetical protein [Deferribacteres bacterium]